ncbi:MAG: hypothetical protein DBX47_02455 [Clostridiales bacterium]|nr:MAG: hypothetical protein DBX47_02455 [Clostridiales bacterium]
MKTNKSVFKIINYIIVALSAIILVGIVLFVDGIDSFVNVFKNTNFAWLLCGAVLMFVYWLCEAGALHVAVLSVNKPFNFGKTLKATILGQYYNCITPSASGGQPMQAYYLYNSGMPVGAASSALLVRFIVFQCALTVYCAVVLIFRYPFFAANISGFSALVFVGFAVNSIIVLFMLGISFAPKTVLRFFRFLVKVFAKIRLIKNKDEMLLRVEYEVDKFYLSLKTMQCNIWAFVKMVLFSFLQMTVYFLVPLFVIFALGVTANPLLVISCSACVLMISSFVPLPGAAGGAEGSFLVFFGLFSLGNKISAAILLWRILTFYMPILVGIFFAQKIGGAREREEKVRLAQMQEESFLINESKSNKDN